MAGALVPPRLDAWIEKQTMYNIKYPQCWPLQYQQIHRYCHEMLPELHRTEARKYDNKVWEYAMNGGWWPFTTGEESQYDPDVPWDHIYHQGMKISFGLHSRL